MGKPNKDKAFKPDDAKENRASTASRSNNNNNNNNNNVSSSSSSSSAPTSGSNTTTTTSIGEKWKQSKTNSAKKPEDADEEVINNYKLEEELTYEQILEQFLNYPQCQKDVEEHGHEKRFQEYVKLANTGRANRNGWTIFLERAIQLSDRTAMVWLDGDGKTEKQWTYREFLEKIRQVAHYLQTTSKLPPGSRVILCFVPGLEFFVAFWACLSLGIVAVPVCPPDPFQPYSDVSKKLAAIMENCEPSLILSTSEYTHALEAAQVYRSTCKPNPELEKDEEDEFDIYQLQFACIDNLPDNSQWRSFEFPTAPHTKTGLTLAFLQYTSGSTGSPKGVMVAHTNMVANAINCTMATKAHKKYEHFRGMTGVSWLPTFHDMGLIGFHVAPMLLGGIMVYFSPLDFLRNPLLWPLALSEWSDKGPDHQYVMTGGPPFALELCAKRIREASPAQLGTLDLSRVISIIIGAEPIRLECLLSFTRAYSPYGFTPNSLIPAYGLAENVLHAMSKRDNTYPPEAIYVDLNQLHIGIVQEIKENIPGGKWLVSSGEMRSQDPDDWPGLGIDGHVLVVDPKSSDECAEGTVGELWLFGKSNTAGYWNNPEATSNTFMGRLNSVQHPEYNKLIKKSFVRTGDLGVYYHGQMYVIGRLKEMIILNGTNFYPHDIEESVRTAHKSIRPGCVIAVALNIDGVEKLGVIVELMERKDSTGPKSSTKLSSGQIRVAQKVFKSAQALPTSLRGPAIRGLARLGGWLQQRRIVNTDGEDHEAGGSGYTSDELDGIEQSIRKAILFRFGVPASTIIMAQPRTIMKTSSGKVRRMATLHAFQTGVLDKMIIRKPNSIITSNTTLLNDQSQYLSENDTRQEEARNTNRNVFSDVDEKSVNMPSHQLWKGVSPSVRTSKAALESLPNDPRREPLKLEDVKTRIAKILGEELRLDTETILELSKSFKFDEEKTLDEFGLDSLTAMKIASRLSKEFELHVPLSPFMFFSDPTLTGMSTVIMRLHSTPPAAISALQITKARMENENLSLQNRKLSKLHPGEKAAASLRASTLHTIQDTDDECKTLPSILGIGCAVPGPGAPQSAIMEVIISDMQLPLQKQKLFARIGETCGIDRRYSVLPSIESIYFGRTGVGNNEMIEPRNEIFKQEAPKLAITAAKAAIKDWKGDVSAITHVVAVTCTGIMVPGLEFSIMQALKLPLSTQRLSIQFMGCFGALSGIKTAKAFAAENPANRVLLVCCELCSLHMQLDDRVDNMVGSALFADGAGAVIIGQPNKSEEPLFEIHSSSSHIIPNTTGMMAWEIANSGMIIGLGKEIPAAIYEHIDIFVANMMRDSTAQKTPFTDMKWAIHPGGPMIIQAIADRLGLNQEQIQPVWDVLRKYGNMSSATLLFVLDEMRRKRTTGAWVPSLAFGPGLNIEGALFKEVRTGKSNNDDSEAIKLNPSAGRHQDRSTYIQNTTGLL